MKQKAERSCGRMENVYLDQVRAVLPQVLAAFDTNPISQTLGLGDRHRWAWKLSDYGNAKYQGLANGLARLVASDLLPKEISKHRIVRRIGTMFEALSRLTDRNGSVAEAYPHESSFGLTGFVANDMLSAIALLDGWISLSERARYLGVLAPLIHFVRSTRETHGIISNHLAGAASALVKWKALTGDDDGGRAADLVRSIIRAQSSEGWFVEYQGADPGYQTFCVGYLAEIDRLAPELHLRPVLENSLEFLSHFAHPDGSFGGIYGSRNTRFYAPGGVESLAKRFQRAAALAKFMRASIANQRVVTLSAMDANNLTPMFNSYCWAAVELERNFDACEVEGVVPSVAAQTWRRVFPGAGILIDKGVRHYTILSWKKGGVCYHFLDGRVRVIDCGVVLRDVRGNLYSTQRYMDGNRISIDGNTVRIDSPFSVFRQVLPSPLQFALLRALSLTVMRLRWVNEWVKRGLVRHLITGTKTIPVINTRTVELGANIYIRDGWVGSKRGLERVSLAQPFSTVHMASQGYWQVQDDQESGRALQTPDAEAQSQRG